MTLIFDKTQQNEKVCVAQRLKSVAEQPFQACPSQRLRFLSVVTGGETLSTGAHQGLKRITSFHPEGEPDGEIKAEGGGEQTSLCQNLQVSSSGLLEF